MKYLTFPLWACLLSQKEYIYFSLKKNPLLLKYSPFNITTTASSIHSLGKEEIPIQKTVFNPKSKKSSSPPPARFPGRRKVKNHLWCIGHGGIGSCYGLTEVNSVATKPLTQPTWLLMWEEKAATEESSRILSSGVGCHSGYYLPFCRMIAVDHLPTNVRERKSGICEFVGCVLTGERLLAAS